MSRYIDANKLLKSINENPAEAHNERCAQLLEAILNAPTADVVEVVRCKDCVYCRPYNDGKLYCHKKANIFVPIVDADDYCSCGERSEPQ